MLGFMPMVLAYRIFQLFEWLMILKWLGTTELESKHNGDVLKTTGKKKMLLVRIYVKKKTE